ncbi:hypothetical protein [Devosia insulae]|uniref:hypothetical protein n=1 Tax=Devosia insulae TaxID=408174 RepID=UPI00159EFEF8|nr:hypothetical protein [Devosia insulae]
MFLFKRPGDRRRNGTVDEPLPPREWRNNEMPPFGNVTGLELMVLFLSRQQQTRY